MKWIKCSDKQPSKFNFYLTMDEKSNYVSRFASYKIYKYRPKEKIWWNYGNLDMTNYVTHWMPLPEPPKKE